MLAWLRTLLAERQLRRQLRSAPHVAIADAPEGTLVRVAGAVRPLGERLLVAPLSGRACVYYDVEVLACPGAQTPEDPLPLGGARVIAHERDGVVFVLDDGRGRAVIDVADGVVALPFDHATTSSAAFDASPVQRELLVRNDLIRRDWWGTTFVLYREVVLAPDRWVAVIGAGLRERDPDAAPTGMYRDGAAQRLRMAGGPRSPLLITAPLVEP